VGGGSRRVLPPEPLEAEPGGTWLDLVDWSKPRRVESQQGPMACASRRRVTTAGVDSSLAQEEPQNRRPWFVTFDGVVVNTAHFGGLLTLEGQGGGPYRAPNSEGMTGRMGVVVLTDDWQNLSRTAMESLLSAASTIDNLCQSPSPAPELLDASRAVHQALIALDSWGRA